MEYAIKQTAFLDILGFGVLVMRSANDPVLAKKIFDFLSSIHPVKVHADAYLHVNTAIVPPEELEEVIRIQRLAAEGMHKEWPIDIAYFSDSLVLSSEDSNACFTVLELICTLMVRAWNDYELMIRGGIAIDKLIHISNGPIFGPAMNIAYWHESKLAIHPRVIFEPSAFIKLSQVPIFNKMSRMFSNDGDFHSIQLASAYDHLINGSTLSVGIGVKDQYISSLLASPEKLSHIIAQFPETDVEVRPKYVWIKERIDKLIEDGKFHSDKFLK